MIKVYVMATCPDCFQVKEQLQDNPKYQLIDIGEHVRNLKEFMRLRDSNSAFDSVKENGSDYLLTAGKMQDYIDLYARNEEDKMNPYFAPYIAEDVSNQPDTLILTCEFDPLRDEGEAYGERLKEAGNHVEIHRIKDALHGYFALGIRSLHVQESFEYINHFLEGE